MSDHIDQQCNQLVMLGDLLYSDLCLMPWFLPPQEQRHVSSSAYQHLAVQGASVCVTLERGFLLCQICPHSLHLVTVSPLLKAKELSDRCKQFDINSP